MQAPTSNTALLSSQEQQNVDFDILMEKQRELLKQIREGPEDVNTKYGVNLAPPAPASPMGSQQQQHQHLVQDPAGPIVAHGWTFERVRSPSRKGAPGPSNDPSSTPTTPSNGKKSKRQRRQERQEAEEWISNWHFERIPGGIASKNNDSTSGESPPQTQPPVGVSSPDAAVSCSSHSRGQEESDDAESRTSDTPQWFFERVPAGTAAPLENQRLEGPKVEEGFDASEVIVGDVTAIPQDLPPGGDEEDEDDIVDNASYDHDDHDDSDRDVVMELVLDGDGDENDKIIDAIDDSVHSRYRPLGHVAVALRNTHDMDGSYHEDDGIEGLDEAVLPDDISLEDLVDDDDEDDEDEDDDVIMTLEEEGLLPPHYLEELKYRQNVANYMDEYEHPENECSAAPEATSTTTHEHNLQPSASASYVSEVKISVKSIEEDDVTMGQQDDQHMETPDSSNHSSTSQSGGKSTASKPVLSNLSPTSVMAMSCGDASSPPHCSTSLCSAQGSDVRLPCAEGMDEIFKNTLEKLTESMKRSAESRQSLLIKTERTQEYGRSLCVNQILQSVQSSSHQVDTCLKMYRMPTTPRLSPSVEPPSSAEAPTVAMPTPAISLSSTSEPAPTTSSLIVATAEAVI